MNKLFHNILFPIYSLNELTFNFKSTVEIANHLQCNVHLLYIINKSILSISERTSLLNNNKNVLVELQPNLSFRYEIINEDTQNEMTTYCLKYQIDLAILFERKRNYNKIGWKKISIKRLAYKIGFPVLSISSQEGDMKFDTIVLPVDKVSPVRQILYASYIGKFFKSKIHLISLNKSVFQHVHGESVVLLQAYQLVRDNTDIPVEFLTTDGNDIENAAIRYAKRIKANLIVFSLGRKLNVPAFINRPFSKLLNPLSNISTMIS